MPRLIDADALKREWHMGEKCEECEQDARQCQYVDSFTRMDICSMLDDAPTVNVLAKLWNGLYAEEDKWEKKFCGTQEHDNWFTNYRPWLQNGFEIAIKVLTELGVKE